MAAPPQARAYYQTAGKRESGAPVYTFGGRIDGTVGPFSLGVQAKRTGPRYVNDQNLPFYVNKVATCRKSSRQRPRLIPRSISMRS
jgi:hypothetical protein